MTRPLVLALLSLSALTSGCASSRALENRIAFTPDCKRGFTASLYGPLGLTTEIAAADVAALCPIRASSSTSQKDQAK